MLLRDILKAAAGGLLLLSYANPLVAAKAITMQFMSRNAGCLLTPHLHIE